MQIFKLLVTKFKTKGKALSCTVVNKTSFKTIRRALSCTVVNNVKYVQFVYKLQPCDFRIGCLVDGKVVDLNARYECLPRTMLEFVEHGPAFHAYCNDLLQSGENFPKVPLENVNLLPPIQGMDKVIGIGLNFKDHIEVHKLTPPKYPMFFSKFSSTVVGPCDCVQIRTDIVKQVDYEIELAFVINKLTRNILKSAANECVFGYTICQDISARDWQKEMNGGQFLLGKSMDTFCPIGPCLVTPDEISDPKNLKMLCKVNGEIRQQSNTNQQINDISDIITRLASVMTLFPGDLILTGTPSGVGVYSNKFLQPGDVLYSEIECIGHMENRVIKYC